MEDVGADDPARSERVDEHHHEAEERPAADRGQPDDEPAEEAEPEGDRLVAPLEDVELRAVTPRLQERLREEARAAEQERRADRPALHRLRAVAVVVREDRGQADPDERHRPRAGEHPQREPRVDGAELPVPDRAERLEDRAVEDVGADGVGRLEAEEDDQDRRHQRPAAHARQADEDADQQAREGELPGH